MVYPVFIPYLNPPMDPFLMGTLSARGLERTRELARTIRTREEDLKSVIRQSQESEKAPTELQFVISLDGGAKQTAQAILDDDGRSIESLGLHRIVV